MTELLSTAFSQFQQNTWLELCAVLFGIAYLLLAVKENILCWYAAFISTAIFLYIFWQVDLLMESGLQIYYLAMAVYGWYQWRSNGDKQAKPALAVSTWPIQNHALALAGILAASLLSGYLLNQYTQAQMPFIDSFTTWGAIVTTYMVTRKVLENWIYWLVIDSISIFLYLDRELYFTSLLFAAYIIIIFFGWSAWMKSYKTQTALA